MERILHIKGADWAKGLSTHPTLMSGGIFRLATNFDPFEVYGVMQPSFSFTQYGFNGSAVQQVTKNIKYITGYYDTVSKFYSLADASGSLALYSTTLNGTTTDVSSEITTLGPASAATAARGAIVWNNFFIYAGNTEIRSNAIPVALGSDASVLTGLTSGEHPPTIGADLNLYFPNGNKVGRLINTAGTLSGSLNVFALETGMNIRHLINDGRYLIILADDSSASNVGNFRCVIAYWDYTSGTLTQRFDFRETGLIGGAILDSNVYVFGQDNMYVCNIATSPKIITSFRGNSTLVNAQPVSLASILVRNNSIIWGSNLNSSIFGYGSLQTGQQKVFFQPYTLTSGYANALFFNGLVIWVGSSDAKLLSVGGTRNESILYLSDITFDKPYRLEYIKIVTQRAMTSGDGVIVQVNSQNGQAGILNNATKTFSADGARQILIYKQTGGGVAKQIFNDLSFIEIDSFKVSIISFEIWATPVDNAQQII